MDILEKRLNFINNDIDKTEKSIDKMKKDIDFIVERINKKIIGTLQPLYEERRQIKEQLENKKVVYDIKNN